MRKNYFKFAVSAMVAILVWTSIPQTAHAQNRRQQREINRMEGEMALEEKKAELATKRAELDAQKARNEQQKRKLEELKKDGWKVSGDARTLEVALLDHYDKLKNSKNKQFVGQVSQCQSINVCRQSALNNAITRYSTLVSSEVLGIVNSQLGASPNDNVKKERDIFIANFENKVKANVGGILSESFSVVQENGSNRAFDIYFIINDDDVTKVLEDALERSINETKSTIIEAEEISNFIRKGFSPE